MILGEYALLCYCDAENAAHAHDEFPCTYRSEFGSKARARARRAGWRWRKSDGYALCPKCSGKAPPKKVAP